MVPSAIAGSGVQVNVMVNGQFASHIPGAMSWLYYAFRLVQLPIGIFGVAIATVTLPAVARQHALDDLKAFGKTVEEALRFGFYLTLPASVGLAVVAQPVIQLIYEHGTFTAASTAQTALALQAYTIGLAGYSGIKILVPCFYAMQPPRFEQRKPGTPASGPRSAISSMQRRPLHARARQPYRHRAQPRSLCFVLLSIISISATSGLALATGFGRRSEFSCNSSTPSRKRSISARRGRLAFAFFVRVMRCDHRPAVASCWSAIKLLLAHRTTHSLFGAAILFFNIGLGRGGLLRPDDAHALRVPESVELLVLYQTGSWARLMPRLNRNCRATFPACWHEPRLNCNGRE